MTNLGEKISYYRLKRGMTRKQLAEEICDETTLLRIEKGKQQPRLDILCKLCLKLNIPLDYIVREVDASAHQYIKRVKQLCREYIYFRDFIPLEQLLEQVSEEEIYFHVTDFNHFIRWHKALLTYFNYHDLTMAITQLEQLLTEIYSIVSETDIGISNSLGLMYLDQNRKKEAAHLFKGCYLAIQELPFIEDQTLPIRVAYNYSTVLFFQEDYDQLLSILHKTLYYIKTTHLQYMYGKLNHLLAITYERLELLNEAEYHMQKAVHSFTIEEKSYYLVRSLSLLSGLQYKLRKLPEGDKTLQLALEKLAELQDPKDLPKIIKEIQSTHLDSS